MKKLITFNIIILMFAFTAKAQDIHFSQFYASPLNLNPAYTGFYNANWRVFNNYRNQWSAIGYPFKTLAIGIDKPFKLNSKSNLGIGLAILNDNSGAVGLTINKVFASIAYNTTLDKIHKFSFGLQIGYVVKSFKIDGITFPSQFNGQTGFFDSGLPNYLDTWDQNINFTDFNFGFIYRGKFSKYIPTAGISIFHLNNPKESFLRADDKLAPRIVFNADVEFPIINENIKLNPEILSMYQKRASDWILGTRGIYIFPEKNIIEKAFIGIHSRYSLNNFDALIFMGGLSVYGFDFGLSYDVNISALKQATNYKGAFEISIIYKNITKSLTKIALPCDRY